MYSLRKHHLAICFIVALLISACQAGKAHNTADTVLAVTATIETEPMRTGGDSAAWGTPGGKRRPDPTTVIHAGARYDLAWLRIVNGSPLSSLTTP